MFGAPGPSVFVAVPVFVGMNAVDWRNDPELKKAFGLALLNASTAFEAACKVFDKETNKALFAAANWVNDPIVLAAKEANTKIDETEKLIDKEQFCLTLLQFSREKITYNGNEIYAAEAKDRLKALELYAKAQGFINEKTTEIHNSNVQQNRFIEIQFVEPEKKPDVKVIENTPVEEIEEVDLISNLKMVG